MNLIPTTATAAEKLKRAAKKQRKVTGTSLAVALDAVAQANGYVNWKHVTVCVDQTPASHGTPPLPQELVQLLAEDTKRYPPLPESELAFRSGLVFAMDVKDADGVPLGADVVECEDLWPLAAADLWRTLVHTRDDETGRSLVETVDTKKLISTVQEDLGNYRFFRSTRAAPATLDEAFSQTLGRYFFPPTHVWLAGKFIDMASVAEVRVDGRVVYASSPGGSAGPVRTYSSPAYKPETPAAPIVFDPPPQEGMIFRLDISRLEPGLYESRMSYGDQEIDEAASYPSIRAALEDAAGVTGDVAGLEVAYRGLVVGTYPLQTIRADAEQIAKRAVATHAAFSS